MEHIELKVLQLEGEVDKLKAEIDELKLEIACLKGNVLIEEEASVNIIKKLRASVANSRAI